MASNTRSLSRLPADIDSRSKWACRRDIPLAILAWIALIGVILWVAGHITRSLILLIIAALLAYALAPAVKFLERVMPRFLAILIVYLLILSGISLLCYLIISTAILQFQSLSTNLQSLINPGATGQFNPLEQTLSSFGISPDQIQAAREQIITYLKGSAGSAIPLLRSAVDFALDTVVTAVISIYLLVDGSRVTRWLRGNAPLQQRERMNFLLDTLQRIVGGYIRGQILLSALIGLLVGVGMTVLGVPYAVLLGVLAFIFSFIPVVGTFLSGAICVLLALTKGWLIAVIVLVYFIGVHVFEGEVVGPRIVGQAIGLHPVVSLVALVAGSELFGILGALFASPIVGVIQALIIAFWKEWRDRHPEQFPAQGTVSAVEKAADVVEHAAAPVGEVLSSAEGKSPPAE